MAFPEFKAACVDYFENMAATGKLANAKIELAKERQKKHPEDPSSQQQIEQCEESMHVDFTKAGYKYARRLNELLQRQWSAIEAKCLRAC